MNEEPRPGGRAALVVGGLLLLVAVVVAIRMIPTDWGAAASDTSPSGEEAEAQAEADQVLEQARVVSRAALQDFRSRLDATLGELDQVRDLAAAWTEDVEPLRTNDRGKLLASREDYVRTMTRLLEKERMSSADREAMRTRLVELREPVLEALEDENLTRSPAEEHIREVDQYRAKVSAELRALREDSDAVAGMLRAVTGGTPASVTLEQAIQDIRAREAVARADQQAKEDEARRIEEEKLRKRSEFDAKVWTLEEAPVGDEERRWWLWKVHAWVPLAEDPARSLPQSEWENIYMRWRGDRKGQIMNVNMHNGLGQAELIRRARARSLSVDEYKEWLYADWLKHERWALDNGLFAPK